MPCAAPCVRLPCNLLCSKSLSCGHKCPGICGETCPEGYCHICGGKEDARVDLLEMKTYNEIDPDETPIVVVGCGHFFTAETLDGHIGMGEVYAIDGYGEYTGLKDTAELARAIPRCPDCQGPVRQHTTHRYNRVINRAVIDEMSKRFIVSGHNELQALEKKTDELEKELDTTLGTIIPSIGHLGRTFLSGYTPPSLVRTNNALKKRDETCKHLQKAIESFRDKIANTHKPAQKLHDATIRAIRDMPVNGLMGCLAIAGDIPIVPHDRQIAFAGRMVQIKADSVILSDSFRIVHGLELSAQDEPLYVLIKVPNPSQLARPFFEVCENFITDCLTERLWKLRVEGILSYARIVGLYESHCRSHRIDVENASKHRNIARDFLEEARTNYACGFRDADILLNAVEEMIALFKKEWYEKVTIEEMAAIKAAMVSGPGGLATHSGHWYNCANGHPVSPSTLETLQSSVLC
jgi:hypothetical protein